MTDRLRFPARLTLALAIGLVVAGGVWTCARAGEKPPKVLVIGIDAGEWDVLGPLLDKQKVPNFARLRDKGASGRIRSLEPLTKSPIIWASIATGKVPSKHGISDFFVKKNARTRTPGLEGEAPSTSNLWRARPVWEILGSLGKKVGVVGWWTTWPATPVNGFLISDYAQYADASFPSRDSRRTYPAGLDSLTKALRRSPESVSWAEIFQFVPPFDTTKATARQEQLIHDLKWIYAADMTFYRVGRELYRRNHPDFMTVYLRGVDEISHRYWDIDNPSGTFSPPLTDAEYQWLKNIIPNYYVFTDRLVGELLKEADPTTNVLITSDHGFMGGGKGVMAHKLDGIVFLQGPAVKQGVTISGATVLDITPTILAIYGLPTANDMDGRPIEDALKPAVMKRISREKGLATYETPGSRRDGGEPIASPVDQELRERLRSLGYIQ